MATDREKVKNPGFIGEASIILKICSVIIFVVSFVLLMATFKHFRNQKQHTFVCGENFGEEFAKQLFVGIEDVLLPNPSSLFVGKGKKLAFSILFPLTFSIDNANFEDDEFVDIQNILSKFCVLLEPKDSISPVFSTIPHTTISWIKKFSTIHIEKTDLKNEEYKLSISKHRLSLSFGEKSGFINAITSFSQIFSPSAVIVSQMPVEIVVSEPLQRIRALDFGTHELDDSLLKNLIGYISLARLNTLFLRLNLQSSFDLVSKTKTLATTLGVKIIPSVDVLELIELHSSGIVLSCESGKTLHPNSKRNVKTLVDSITTRLKDNVVKDSSVLLRGDSIKKFLANPTCWHTNSSIKSWLMNHNVKDEAALLRDILAAVINPFNKFKNVLVDSDFFEALNVNNIDLNDLIDVNRIKSVVADVEPLEIHNLNYQVGWVSTRNMHLDDTESWMNSNFPAISPNAGSAITFDSENVDWTNALCKLFPKLFILSEKLWSSSSEPITATSVSNLAAKLEVKKHYLHKLFGIQDNSSYKECQYIDPNIPLIDRSIASSVLGGKFGSMRIEKGMFPNEADLIDFIRSHKFNVLVLRSDLWKNSEKIDEIASKCGFSFTVELPSNSTSFVSVVFSIYPLLEVDVTIEDFPEGILQAFVKNTRIIVANLSGGSIQKQTNVLKSADHSARTTFEKWENLCLDDVSHMPTEFIFTNSMEALDEISCSYASDPSLLVCQWSKFTLMDFVRKELPAWMNWVFFLFILANLAINIYLLVSREMKKQKQQ
eukprot:TRINITY_DN2042_c0_g1_i2.p1 TRINITY_DN2042_c0_g1~~TRINITY_DN2042_c0_g1_i2.p1  ORF type:complete len:772 (+),score=97.29 TRINITY_DN2042_c0_g1_i2:111-2426(+)